MNYTQLLSRTAGGGSPNNRALKSSSKNEQDMLSRIADRNKPASPMQPANIPGRSTPAKIQPAKTYVMPPPITTQAPAQPQAAAEQPMPSVPTPPPAPATPQYRYDFSGMPQGWNLAGLNAFGSADFQREIDKRAPNHYAVPYYQNLLQQAKRLEAVPAPAPVPTPQPTPPPVTGQVPPPPPPPVQYQPTPTGVTVPLPDPASINQTMTQLSQQPFYQDVKKFLPDIKTEGLLEVMNMLQNRQGQRENLQTLQRGEATMAMMGNDPYTERMNELRSSLASGALNRLNAPSQIPEYNDPAMATLRDSLVSGLQGVGQDEGVAAALRQSLMGTLENPDPVSQAEYEAMQTQARNAAFQSRNRSLDALRENLAVRGIEGGVADSMMLQAMMQSDASGNAALQDLAIQRALGRSGALQGAQDRMQSYLNASGSRNQGLLQAQSALGGFLGDRERSLLDRYSLESQNRLADLSAASGVLGQDYGQRNALAQMIAMQQLAPEDWGNLISTYSVGHRPIPQESGGSDSTSNLLSILGTIGNLGLGVTGLSGLFGGRK